MNTPAQVATDTLNDYEGETFTRLEVWKLLQATIAVERANQGPEKKFRHIVFTGPFEEFHSLEDAQDRLEELLDAGHDKPTVVNAQLTPDGKVVGLTAQRVIRNAQPGKIL